MRTVSAFLWSPVVALQLLTRLPLPAAPNGIYEADCAARRMSLVFFPAVGALVGAITGVAYIAASHMGIPTLACAAIAIGVSALVTGGFHEDGLADVADSLGKFDRDEALEVMRDSRIGSFGAIAIWVALTAKAGALAQIPAGHILFALTIAGAFSRAAPTMVVAAIKPARSTLGRSSAAVTGAGVVEALFAFLVAFGIGWALIGPTPAALLVTATAIAALISIAFYRQRFGGFTGDCLGATTMLVEIVILCLLAASKPPIW